MDKSRYTAFHDKCSEIEQRFGRQGRLPLKPLDLSAVKCKKLLDFGAGKGLNASWCEEYYTLDADKTLAPNFTSIDEVCAAGITFEGLIANQVFEHIKLDDIDGVMMGLHSVLSSGAKFIATIPNVHRGSYFFNDIDHKTPLMYYHLASFLEINGFDVIDAYRYTKNYHAIANADNETKKLMDLLEKMYELDPAQFIAVLAQKK